MATTDTNVPQVIVNKLTQAQYDTAVKSPTEFYAVTDGKIETADIADGAVTAVKMDSAALSSGIITLTAKSGFTINSQNCGYCKIAGKTLVTFNASISGSVAANVTTEVCTVAGLPTISGYATPQLSAEASIGWGTPPSDDSAAAVGCWLREASLAIAIENYRSTASAANTTFRITGSYMF